MTLKVVTVVVVPEVNCKVRALPVSEKFIVLKVLEPLITKVPVEFGPVYISVPYVRPPPRKERLVALTLVLVMVDEAPEKVRLVGLLQLHIVPVALRFMVEVPKVSVRTPAPDEVKLHEFIV